MGVLASDGTPSPAQAFQQFQQAQTENENNPVISLTDNIATERPDKMMLLQLRSFQKLYTKLFALKKPEHEKPLEEIATTARWELRKLENALECLQQDLLPHIQSPELEEKDNTITHAQPSRKNIFMSARTDFGGNSLEIHADLHWEKSSRMIRTDFIRLQAFRGFGKNHMDSTPLTDQWDLIIGHDDNCADSPYSISKIHIHSDYCFLVELHKDAGANGLRKVEKIILSLEPEGSDNFFMPWLSLFSKYEKSFKVHTDGFLIIRTRERVGWPQE